MDSRSLLEEIDSSAAAALSPLEAFSSAVIAIGEAVAPSVAAVRINRPGPVASPAFGGATRVSGAGSGVVLSPGGIIATAAHVVARADEVSVAVAGRAPCNAEVIGLDGSTDIAVLRIAASDLAAVEEPSPAPVRPGQVTIAIGRPPGYGVSITAGLISALERSVRSTSGDFVENVIQTSAAIGPGTSGGALVDERGRFVGLLTSVAEESAGAISFAIPAEAVRWVCAELLENGRVARAQLGLSGETAPLSAQRTRGRVFDQESGVVVRSQPSNSPSARAGLAPGDIILRLNGRPVTRLGELHRGLCRAARDDQITLAVLRDGELLDFRVEPAADAGPGVRGS